MMRLYATALTSLLVISQQQKNLHLKSPLGRVTPHLEASDISLDAVLIIHHQREPMMQMYILHQRAYDAVLGAQHY